MDTSTNPESFLEGSVEIEQPLDEETPDWIRLQVTQWPDEVRAVLDRLTVVGVLDALDVPGVARWVGTSPLLGSARPAMLPYRWSHTVLGGGGLLQYGDARQSSGVFSGAEVHVRYDFNPAHVPHEWASEILSWFDEPRVTRLDVAIDYPRDLSGCGFDRARASRTEHRSASGRLETVYLGAPGSKLRFVCYDKAREREYAGQSTPEGRDWWRVEARYRPGRDDPILPIELFRSVEVTEPVPAISGNWRDVAALKWAHMNPAFVKALHWRNRRTIEEGLDGLLRPLLPSPRCVYELCSYGRLREEVTAFLR